MVLAILFACDLYRHPGIFSQELGNSRKGEWQHCVHSLWITFSFGLLILCWNSRMEWCDEKIELVKIFFAKYFSVWCLIEWLSQSDKKAAYQPSAIINFDAVNRRQFFCAGCNRHEKLVPESGIEFMAASSGAGFWSMCQWLKSHLFHQSYLWQKSGAD